MMRFFAPQAKVLRSIRAVIIIGDRRWHAPGCSYLTHFLQFMMGHRLTNCSCQQLFYPASIIKSTRSISDNLWFSTIKTEQKTKIKHIFNFKRISSLFILLAFFYIKIWRERLPLQIHIVINYGYKLVTFTVQIFLGVPPDEYFLIPIFL